MYCFNASLDDSGKSMSVFSLKIRFSTEVSLRIGFIRTPIWLVFSVACVKSQDMNVVFDKSNPFKFAFVKLQEINVLLDKSIFSKFLF